MKNFMGFLLIASSLFSGCAINRPNFKLKPLETALSRVTLYWPRQWQSQFGRYQIDVNHVPYKILKNEGYVEILAPEGPLEIRSHHFQDPNFEVVLKLEVHPQKNYYFRLDTEPKEVTLVSALSDIASVGLIVEGVQAEAKLEGNGNLNFSDVSKIATYRSFQEEQKAKARSIGYHVLSPVEEKLALSELTSCCTSEQTAEYTPPKPKDSCLFCF